MRDSHRRSRFRVALFLGIGLATTGIGLLAYGAGLLRPVELPSIDARFSIRGTQEVPPEVVVVKIDDVTFNDWGIQWPFPRSLHGRAIERIAEAGASAIVYDVQFTEATVEEEDNALIDAVEHAGNVVLATTEVGEGGESNVFGGDEVVHSVGARAGNALFPPDPGGVLRLLPYEVDGLRALSVVAVERFTGREVPASAFAGPPVYIDYAGPPGTIPAVSFSRVVDGKVPDDFFRGKLVVIGPSAPTLKDVHPTPTSGSEFMAGAEVQANAISTVLRSLPLRGVPAGLTLALIVVFGLFAPVAGLLLGLRLTLGLSALTGAAYAVAAQVAFEQGRVLSFTYPFGALVVSSVGVLGSYYVLAAIDRERARDAFSRFVPDTVVEQVLARTDEQLRLGGVEMTGTAMFTDLRGFTSFSEKLPAAQVIQILNVYLGEMSEAILDHGGTLVAYMGDGIFAVFGAPIEQSDHADRALAASREMLTERLPRFNEWMSREGYGEGFRMGIGLNSGPFVSGNVGSERRLEYTAIGDTTNTASRLEGMTKGTPFQLFLSDTTQAALTGDADDLVYVEELEVRGRESKVRLWSIESAVDAGALSAGERAAAT